jgi:hypothetical protein
MSGSHFSLQDMHPQKTACGIQFVGSWTKYALFFTIISNFKKSNEIFLMFVSYYVNVLVHAALQKL